MEKLLMIVDDLDGFSDMLCDVASERGYNARLFSDEDSAFEYLQTSSPHVAVVHFSEDMRRSTDFIYQLHQKDKSIAIIYITAYSGEQVHMRALQNGAFSVMAKPFRINDLFDKIESAYKKSKAIKEYLVRNQDVFVIMPFAKKFDNLYVNAIKKPLQNLGFACERADEIHFTGKVLEKVLVKIERSGIIIANITGNNPNVFYEIGYAHALRKKIIFITEASAEVPFNLKNYKHIVYRKSYKKLSEELICVLNELR